MKESEIVTEQFEIKQYSISIAFQKANHTCTCSRSDAINSPYSSLFLCMYIHVCSALNQGLGVSGDSYYCLAF